MTNSEHSSKWPVWGHDWAVDFLQRTVAYKRNRHAYLITGARQVGKMQLALTFAMVLNCTHEDESARPCMQCRSCKLINSGNHPDILFSRKDEKSDNLKIDEIREVMRLIALKPFSSRFRIAIFDEFDAAQNRAQDALLKTLEEPPPHAVLILLAESTENIMPTITSRCQIIPLRPIPLTEVQRYLEMHGADEEKATLLARLSNGRIGWALTALRDEVVLQERNDMLNMLNEVIGGNRVRRFELAEELEKIGKKDKAALRYLLEMWQAYWRDVLLLAQGSPVKPCNTDRLREMEGLLQHQHIQPEDALKALQATRSMLMETLKTNANMRMAFEVLFLDYPGLSH